MSGGARRVAVNAAAPFAAGFAGRALSWVLAIVMARTLGPEGTGAYAFAVNLWLYASIVADFGLGTWLTREIARQPDAARPALRRTLGFRLLLSTLAVPLLVGAALVATAATPDKQIPITVLLLGLGLLPGAVSAAGTALFNAHELMTVPAAVQLLSGALTAAGGTVALLTGHGIVALGWVSLAVNLVTAAVFLLASRRRFFALDASFDLRGYVSLARDALPLMLNSLLNSVFFRVDVQVLQSQGSATVGYYANAYKVIDAAGAVPSSFVLALFPILSRRAAGGPGEPGDSPLARVYHLALKLLIATALPLATLITFGAWDLTRWFWGSAFLPHSAVALQILIWFLPLSVFNGLTQYVLIAAGRQHRITPAFALAAFFNLGANLLLIPWWSYRAAAAVTIASEVVLLVPFALALRGTVPVRPVFGAALRPLPAAALMALALAALAPWSRLGAVAVAVAVYLPALALTRAFDAAEWATLASLLPPAVAGYVRGRRLARASRAAR